MITCLWDVRSTNLKHNLDYLIASQNITGNHSKSTETVESIVMEKKAILCILGSILINLTLGTFYSIGNVVPYIASYMRKNGNPDVTTEHGAWFTALFLLGQGSFIMAGSFMEQQFNSRIACIFGCILHNISTYLTMWAINKSFFMTVLVYGLGSGLGTGSAYGASIIAAQKWMPHHKSIATGMIVSGFGFGGSIFTPLQTLYMNPNNTKPDSSGYFTQQSVYDRVPNLFLYMGIIFTTVQIIGCALAFPPPPSTGSAQVQIPSTKTPTSSSNNNTSTTVVNDEVLPNINSFCGIFKHKVLYVIALMMMLVAPGVTFVNSLGKRYGQSYITDDRYLSTVVAISAIANAVGRLSWGFLLNTFSFSTCYILKIGLFATLIILFPFSFVLSSSTLYLIWMLGLFFGFSGTFVLFPVFIEQLFGVKYHGAVYGLTYLFLALSSIITSFLIQITVSPALDSSKNSDENLTIRLIPCIIIAVCYVMSLVLFFVLLPVRRLEGAIKRKIDFDTTRTKTSLFNRQDLFPVDKSSLAEKTANPNNGNLEKENSLGSIVRFREIPSEEKRIKTLAKQ